MKYLEQFMNDNKLHYNYKHKIRNYMQIPEEIYKKWLALRSHGDGRRIKDETGISIVEVSRAFTYKECSDDAFKAMADFYKKKEELVNAYM